MIISVPQSTNRFAQFCHCTCLLRLDSLTAAKVFACLSYRLSPLGVKGLLFIILRPQFLLDGALAVTCIDQDPWKSSDSLASQELLMMSRMSSDFGLNDKLATHALVLWLRQSWKQNVSGWTLVIACTPASLAWRRTNH